LLLGRYFPRTHCDDRGDVIPTTLHVLYIGLDRVIIFSGNGVIERPLADYLRMD